VEVISMQHSETDRKIGLQRLIRKGKEQFRIPENTLYYSDEHYQLAEKKFIKLCIIGGKC
jgi:hypothetical protein